MADFLAEERRAGTFEPLIDAWMGGYDRKFSRKLGAKGWLGINWPEQYGGGGRSHVARLAVTEELLRSGAPVASHWVGERQIGPAILRYGSEELKDEFLPSLAAGELTFCLGMSESEAGSDLAAVETSAASDGNGFIVTGTKIWTTLAHHADFAYVLACTDHTAEKDGRLTELLVDMTDSGVEVRPIHDLAGRHHFNEVAFEGVSVPASRVIGRVGRGWEQVTTQLAFERGGPERFLSTYPLLELLASRARGPALERIGELLARLRGLRALAWQVAREMDAGVAPVGSAAILKMLGAQFEQDVVEAGRALVEGEPEPEGSGVGGMLADAQLALPAISLRGGATEILAGIIARTAK